MAEVQDHASRILRAVERMPSLPTTVMKVLEVANNPTSTANDLNKVISLDAVLTAKVLKVVNSAYFGLDDQITSLVRAIIMLGLTTIKNLALSTAAIEALDMKGGALNMDEYWKHTIAVGVTSRLLARKMSVNKNYIENYFVAGLLHDIGKVVMNRYNPQGYKKLMEICNEKRFSLVEGERRVFQVDHAEVGGKLAEKWGFTNDLTEAIYHHHNPENASEEARPLVTAVFISNIFANSKKIGFSGNSFIQGYPNAIWDNIGLSENCLFDVEQTLNEGIEKASVFLKSGAR